MQSYIREGEVKTLEGRVVKEKWGKRERGVRSMAEFKSEGLSQLFLSFGANGKNREFCSRVAESHIAFISWRL